ncbi:galactosyltransferase-related protein [Aeromonas veronii]
MDSEINVIIPLHEPNRNKINRIKRLRRCINCFSKISGMHISIPSNIDLSLDGVRVCCQVVYHAQAYSVYSPGAARNKAIKQVESDNILCIDADLLCSPILVDSLDVRASICRQQGEMAFEMYPCLYLTKEETERFDGDFQGCLESFLRGENHRVEGIALASSCLLMNREWFLQLGGFDEQFVGHGGEDLELIDRLTRHYP